MCEGLVYSLIFWNQEIGEACVDQIGGMADEMMLSELETQQRRVQKLINEGKYEHKDHRLAYNMDVGTPFSCPEIPVVQGQFTNWHPYKMMPIEEYCDAIDRHQPNFINMMKKDGKCRKDVYAVDDLNSQEAEDYEIMKQDYMRNYYVQNFHTVIEKNLPYKKPNLVFNEYLPQY